MAKQAGNPTPTPRPPRLDSKWSLLRSAMFSKRVDRTSDASASMHAFRGFNGIVPSEKVIFAEGFQLDVLMGELSMPVHSIVDDYIYDYMEKVVDCTEITCNMIARRGAETQQLLAVVANELTRQPRRISVKGISTSRTSGMTIRVSVSHQHLIPSMAMCEYKVYTPNTLKGGAMSIYTREKPLSSAPSLADLLSNKTHGVDNTGNIRVWPAENILLHCFLKSGSCSDSTLFKINSCSSLLELGGGLTGLCGLGIAATGCLKNIVVTDGHPQCVLNMNACIHLCKQKQTYDPSVTTITASRLMWSVDDRSGDLARAIALNSGRKFDIIIASDCLFFKDFHMELISTLCGAINGPTSPIYLLQPRRAGTMQLFMERASAYFNIAIYEDYSAEVSQMKRQFASEATFKDAYDDDIHYAILIVMFLKVTDIDL